MNSAMENTDLIKRRIKKLLALSKSPNLNEAEAALEKANALMAEHGLSESDCAEIIKECAKGVKEEYHWSSFIASAVAWLYGCTYLKELYYGGCDVEFYGDGIHAFMAKEMYLYLKKAAARIARQNISRRAGEKSRKAYKMGIAKNLSDRIYELGEKVSWAPEREKQRELSQKWIDKNLVYEQSDKKPSFNLNKDAMQKGYFAAEQISLNRQANGNSSGNLLLESA